MAVGVAESRVKTSMLRYAVGPCKSGAVIAAKAPASPDVACTARAVVTSGASTCVTSADKTAPAWSVCCRSSRSSVCAETTQHSPDRTPTTTTPAAATRTGTNRRRAGSRSGGSRLLR